MIGRKEAASTQKPKIYVNWDPNGAGCTGGVPDQRPVDLWTDSELRLWKVATRLNEVFCAIEDRPEPDDVQLSYPMFVVHAGPDLHHPAYVNMHRLKAVLKRYAQLMTHKFPVDAVLEYCAWYDDDIDPPDQVHVRVQNITLRNSRSCACRLALDTLTLFLKRDTLIPKDVRLMLARLLWASRREGCWDPKKVPRKSTNKKKRAVYVFFPWPPP
jgi:hypothetical protein